MSTWKELITTALAAANETWNAVEACTLSETELNREFDDGYGVARGTPFTLWTKNRVYFPVVYDGAEWAASVPRHPSNEATEHVGGQ